MELDPQHAEALQGKADCLHKLGYHPEALQSVDQSIHIKPDLSLSYFVRSCIHTELGHVEKAYDDLVVVKPQMASDPNFLVQEQRVEIPAVLLKLERLEVKTAANQAVFWSGPGNREKAETYAASAGGCTLEMTRAGQYLDALKLFDRYPRESAMRPWEMVSGRFAQSASGRVKAFTLGASPFGIFRRIELPILRNNPRVTAVIEDAEAVIAAPAASAPSSGVPLLQNP